MKRFYKRGMAIGMLALMVVVGSEIVVNAAPTSQSYNVPYEMGNRRASLTVYKSAGYAHAGTYQNYTNGAVRIDIYSNKGGGRSNGIQNASLGYVNGTWWDCIHTFSRGGVNKYHYSNI